MRKLLNISVFAALTILPVMANAEVFAVADPTTDANAAVAATDPKWALVEAGDNDNDLATAGYVKGAYNQAMKAINKVATTAAGGVKGVKVNGAELTPDANGKVDVLVSEGSANGTISVNNANVAVHGLGSAAYVNTGSIAGTAGTYDDTTSNLGATTIQGAIQALDTVVDSLNTASANYAKKTGVTQTITNSTVKVLTTWGSDTATNVAGLITGATYAEPAVQQ